MDKRFWVILGAVVVVLLGVYWWIGGAAGLTEIPTPETATTTPEVAANSATGKVSVAKRATDVASIASSLSGASTFASLFASTGVKSSITGPGPYTIFVPTDGSISLLPKGTIQDLSAAEKKRFVQYHIISGRAVDPNGIETGFMTALSGDTLNFDVSDTDETARINNAFVVKAYQGSNGVVYLISAPLLPPTSINP